MSLLPRSSILALALLLAGATAASATEVIHQDTRALVRGSADIVVGRVEGARSYWNAAHTKILTDVTLVVSETLKGQPGERLVLTQLGGELDGMRYNVPGSPAFAPGEEALVFVWRDPQGRAQVNGLAQGKFDIRRDPATGERLVPRALPGLAVRDVRTLALVPQGGRPARLTLDDLEREIRRVLADDGR